MGAQEFKFREDYLPFGRPDFSEEEIKAVSDVMRSGWVGMGPQTIEFEKELSGFIGAPEVVSVNSCTSGLFLALIAAGIKPGDEVIVPSFTWCSSANVAIYQGARPIFCDIDPKSFCITPETIASKITGRTRAVIAVHFGGLACDVAAIKKSLPPHVALIEDAAHALGASYNDGAQVGSSGNLTCYSFYANKNLSTGEGGAIALFDREQSQKLQSLRMHGLANSAWKRFINPKVALVPGLEDLGYKMNYTDLQAAIGRVQLRRQKEFAKKKLAMATYYKNFLDSEFPQEFIYQDQILSPGHARHLFKLLLPIEKMKVTRDDFLMQMRDNMIGIAVHYSPLHKMPLYGYQASLPVTDDIAERCVTVPVSAGMSMADAETVMKTFAAVYKQCRK